jgi:toxin ParE1/3/4
VKRLRVLPEADADIDESALYYTGQAGIELGLRFYAATEETFAWILENPKGGAPREFLNPRLRGLRMWPVRGFEKRLVFYRKIEGEVEIVRVLHGARDIEAVLQGEE